MQERRGGGGWGRGVQEGRYGGVLRLGGSRQILTCTLGKRLIELLLCTEGDHLGIVELWNFVEYYHWLGDLGGSGLQRRLCCPWVARDARCTEGSGAGSGVRQDGSAGTDGLSCQHLRKACLKGSDPGERRSSPCYAPHGVFGVEEQATGRWTKFKVTSIEIQIVASRPFCGHFDRLASSQSMRRPCSQCTCLKHPVPYTVLLISIWELTTPASEDGGDKNGTKKIFRIRTRAESQSATEAADDSQLSSTSTKMAFRFDSSQSH